LLTEFRKVDSVTVATVIEYMSVLTPRAIITTLVISALLYISVGTIGIDAIGPGSLTETARADVAPLFTAARTFGLPAASERLRGWSSTIRR
jgi:APA family basic amino acid/polyamine antiporter